MANKTLNAELEMSSGLLGRANSPTRGTRRFCLPLLLVTLCCGHIVQAAGPTVSAHMSQTMKQSAESSIWMNIGERRFAVTLSGTEAASAFTAMLPLTLNMEELNGNEKYGELDKALPTDARRVDTIHNGDLLLWGSRTAVVFYKTFDSSYSYTRLGRVEAPEELAKVLGKGSVLVAFSKQ